MELHYGPESGEMLARREFIRRAGAASALMAGARGALGRESDAATKMAGPSMREKSETAVKALYESLSDSQRKTVCFGWDHVDKDRGLLRTFVANNWHITEPTIDSDFFTKKQRHLVYDVFENLFDKDWVSRFVKQLRDDTFGAAWGADQNIAIFGQPGDDKFQFVMTGRHMTVRADGNSEAHMAFGGPIFHGHAADGFNEKAHHPGNIFWHQGVMANKVCDLLDGKQREIAIVKKRPAEQDIEFQPIDKRPGIPVSKLSGDQKEALQKVLDSLIEPYRQADRDEVKACLDANGGLDACNLAFYSSGDIGDDGVWDNWRLEGPAMAWYFRGSPHVHIWIRVAENPAVELNEEV